MLFRSELHGVLQERMRAHDDAGVTGDDGASHNGVWDISMLLAVPGLRLAAPRDEATLRRALREAVAATPISSTPTAAASAVARPAAISARKVSIAA